MKDTYNFSLAVRKLRAFFQDQLGFVEVPAQSRLSILAACEDPNTITRIKFAKDEWPLPQTGQMWLEREILENPSWPGVFCVTTSYRNEPNPVPGRHDLIFPMFEFESKGTMAKLAQIEMELCKFLGFSSSPIKIAYEDACKKYSVQHLEAEHETNMASDLGSVVMLTDFPQRSHPFWNMKQNGPTFNKIDVLLHGMETIGSAERSSNVEEMRQNFHSVSNGQYAQKLFDLFGEKRVMDELNDYLSLPMFERFGAGIGMTRLVRAMKMEGIL